MEDRAERRDSRPVGNSAGTLPVSMTVGAGRTAVQLRLLEQGRDILVLISGGDAHVGAIAACDGRIVPTAAVKGGTVQMPGHREGPLATEAAETLAAAAGRTCAAVVGIHQDQATPAEIQDIVAHARRGLQQLAALFTEGNPR